MSSLLRVEDLTVRYGVGGQRFVSALSHVSFDLAAGEAVGILGESGCGKTTLAMTLLGLLPSAASIASGAILFQGTNLLGLEERDFEKVRGAAVSLVHQEPGLALNPVLRVGDQIAEVLRAHQHLSSRQARQKSRELLAQVGLQQAGIAGAYPHQLSGGQRQRVVIAQAIACHPALIIADEPTTALDAATGAEIMALLQSLRQELGLAILLISHDPAVLAPIAQRILVFYAGRIVEEGPTREILASPLHPYTQGLLRCGWAMAPGSPEQPLTSLPGEPPNLAALPVGCAFAPRCAERMEICDNHPPAAAHPERARHVWCCKYD